jgi:hypothetical protein
MLREDIVLQLLLLLVGLILIFVASFGVNPPRVSLFILGMGIYLTGHSLPILAELGLG